MAFVQFSHEIGRVDVQNWLFIGVSFICGWSFVVFQSILIVKSIQFNLGIGICPIFTRNWSSWCSKSTICSSFVHLWLIFCHFSINFNCRVDLIQFEQRHLSDFHTSLAELLFKIDSLSEFRSFAADLLSFLNQFQLLGWLNPIWASAFTQFSHHFEHFNRNWPSCCPKLTVFISFINLWLIICPFFKKKNQFLWFNRTELKRSTSTLLSIFELQSRNLSHRWPISTFLVDNCNQHRFKPMETSNWSLWCPTSQLKSASSSLNHSSIRFRPLNNNKPLNDNQIESSSWIESRPVS